MIKHIFRGAVAPTTHMSAVIGNVCKAGFARKSNRNVPKDDSDINRIIRIIQAGEQKILDQRERKRQRELRRSGVVVQEDVQTNEKPKEPEYNWDPDASSEVVYDEELKGYFRKDAIDRLKADPDFLTLIQQIEDKGSEEPSHKKKKGRKALKAGKLKTNEIEEEESALSDAEDSGELESLFDEQQIQSEDGQRTQLKGKKITKIARNEKQEDKAAISKIEHDEEDDLFKELDEFKIEQPEILQQNISSTNLAAVNQNASKPSTQVHNKFVIKLDPKTLQRAQKIVHHEDKHAASNKKQNAPALYIDFQNTKEVSTFVNDQSIELFSRTLKKLSPGSLTKILGDTKFIEKNPAQNSLKMLLLLTHMRRNRLMKSYDRQDIRQHAEKMIENLPALSPEIITMLVHNLDKMRINDPEYFRKLETFIIAHAANFNLRCLSNIVYSFANASMRQSIISDFSQLYKSLEIPISLKLKEKQPKDLAQIMTGYSKTQNFSNEFLQVMEKACYDAKDNMQCQELAIIIHSFWKNDYRSERLLKFASKL